MKVAEAARKQELMQMYDQVALQNARWVWNEMLAVVQPSEPGRGESSA